MNAEEQEAAVAKWCADHPLAKGEEREQALQRACLIEARILACEYRSERDLMNRWITEFYFRVPNPTYAQLEAELDQMAAALLKRSTEEQAR